MGEPKKPYKILTVVIRTINVKTEEVVTEVKRIIDGPDRRDWLKDQMAKTAMAAMLNGCYMEVISQEDDD